MSQWISFFLIGFYTINASFANEKLIEKNLKQVGLCIMATGRYDLYADELIKSARPYFCTNSKVTYFVFTDGQITPAEDVVQIYQKRLGWPQDTLKRFHVYNINYESLKQMDYLFALDADMRFVAPVGEEILSDLVATEHPGYIGKRGTYETNQISTAYVSKKEGSTYFAGGFYGGSKESFFKFTRKADEQIDQDLTHDFIAVWHDESHLNRYFINNKPSLILNASYCYPECMKLSLPKKIIALDKNHAEMRKL